MWITFCRKMGFCERIQGSDENHPQVINIMCLAEYKYRHLFHFFLFPILTGFTDISVPYASLFFSRKLPDFFEDKHSYFLLVCAFWRIFHSFLVQFYVILHTMANKVYLPLPLTELLRGDEAFFLRLFCALSLLRAGFSLLFAAVLFPAADLAVDF